MIVKFLFGLIFCISNMALKVHCTPIAADRTDEIDNVHEDKLQHIFAESIQHELKTFFSSLNAEEKVQLKKFAKTSATNFSLTNLQFLDGLKNEAAGLFGKLIGLRDIINAKLSTMQPESRQFIEKLLQRFLAAFSQDGLMNILKALKGFGKEVIDMFDTLSKPVQDDILKAFPIIGSYATSDIARLILRKLAEMDFISKTSTQSPNKDDSGKHFSRPQVIEPDKPGNLDEEDNTYHKKKESLTTTMYPLVDDEESLSIKKIVVNK